MAQRDHVDWTADQRQRVEELIDDYRVALHDSLNDLTEEEARRRLVPLAHISIDGPLGLTRSVPLASHVGHSRVRS